MAVEDEGEGRKGKLGSPRGVYGRSKAIEVGGEAHDLVPAHADLPRIEGVREAGGGRALR